MSTRSTARMDWTVWGTDAVLTVTDSAQLVAARGILDSSLLDVERAASRFRPDSELSLLTGRAAAGVSVSPLLARLVDAALRVAARTKGCVDPTLGNRLAELGYDRDLAEVRARADFSVSAHLLPPQDEQWRRVRLEGTTLTVPDDLALDLGATAKAVAVDDAAALISRELGCGVLVGLGGDVATAGPGPDGPWQIDVCDVPGDPAQQISLSPGWAIATSSTQRRRWTAAGRTMHHILDPRSGLPAPETWRSVTVVADSCLDANAVSTAAIVRGPRAIEWINTLGYAARLVSSAGRVHAIGGWPPAARALEEAGHVR
ncbi:FAD:protein FMN transferase [Gryllotalpicola koreensis]|uniref:FAD:protein FMN transferase n=1 Tax=Gryllotalpicola koreensis TaxID=993086 RepID=A0ABP7ZRU6_9MICO